VEASEEDDAGAEVSESETGRKVTKAKRKRKAASKMESVQEKIEDEIEDVEADVEVEEAAEPVKPKRGRPPAAKKITASSSRKKKTPEDDDTETKPAADSTTKHTRTRSKANLQSDAEVEQEKTQSRTKSKSTSGKKIRTPAIIPPDDDAPEYTTSKSKDKIRASELAIQAPKPGPKGRAVPRLKSKPQVVESDSDDPLARNDQSQTKTRKSSSTSDDAGYATAEVHMEVDDVQTAPQQGAEKPHQDRTDDVAMDEIYDRDSGLAESVGPPSPPYPYSSLPQSSNKKEPIRQPASSLMDTDNESIPTDYARQGSEISATPPPATSSSPPSRQPDPSTPKSKTVQFLPAISEPEPEPEPITASEPAFPDSLLPLLANMPLEKLSSLTEDEGAMTIEQYIRREIEIQYQRFKEDGERRIALFKEKAAETRRIIETS